SDPGADVHVPADRLHVHAVVVSRRAGDLLVVEQPPQHRPAMDDHAQAGRGLSGAPAEGPPAKIRLADIFPARDIEAEKIEAGRLLFAQECRFVAGAGNPAALPPETLPEIAFIGR